MLLKDVQAAGLKGMAQGLRSVDPLEWGFHNCYIQVDDYWVPYSLRSSVFRTYSLLEGIFDVFSYSLEKSVECIVMKPTQFGVTTMAMILMLYFIANTGRNVMYMLPVENQLNDFAHNRLDKMILHSPRLAALFQDISNVGLKVAKKGGLYLRGSNSTKKMEEVPAGFVIRDEIDKMHQANAELALKRLSGQVYKWIFDLSHPTYPEEGIDARYKESSMNRYWIECPKCGEKQYLQWPHNIDIAHERLICRACDTDQFTRKWCWDNGYWEAEDPKNPVIGFHFNQFLSPTVSIHEIVREWNKAQGKPHRMEIFWNTVLALPYAQSTEALTAQQVRDCFSGYEMQESASDTFMGIDVNRNHMHVWVEDGKVDKVLWAGIVEGFDRLDDLVKRFRPKIVVIDANPDWHKTYEWCETLAKRTGVNVRPLRWEHTESKQTEPTVDHKNMHIAWSRTRGLDELHDRFRVGGVVVPANISPDVIDQLCAPKRVLVETPGRPTKAKYVEDSPDHFAFAAMFAVLARKLGSVASAADRYKIQTPGIRSLIRR